MEGGVNTQVLLTTGQIGLSECMCVLPTLWGHKSEYTLTLWGTRFPYGDITQVFTVNHKFLG